MFTKFWARSAKWGRNGGLGHVPDAGFLSRVSILTRDIDIAILPVCPSVRNVPVSDENGLTYRHIFSPYGSQIILVLPALNIFTKFRELIMLLLRACRWS